MSEFEVAVLSVLAKAHEPLGWYVIERQLAQVKLAERPHLVNVLSKLCGEGFVALTTGQDTQTRYRLTDAGATLLREQDSSR